MILEFKGEYAFLSNFYYAPFILETITYSTVEHYFQAQKAIDSIDFKRILSTNSPGEAKAIGRKIKIRSDWDEIKNNIKESLLKKYNVKNVSQIQEVKEKIKNKNLNKYGNCIFFKSDYFKRNRTYYRGRRS